MLPTGTAPTLVVLLSLFVSPGYAFLYSHARSGGNNNNPLKWPTECFVDAVQPIHHYVPTQKHCCSWRLHAKNNKKDEVEEDEYQDEDDDEEESYYADLFSTRNQAIWDKRLKELADYKKKFGTVNVPGSTDTTKDYEYGDLATFLTRIRRRQSRVNAEQRAQLDALNFTWTGSDFEKFDQRWEEKFQRLVEYQKIHGHCRVPSYWPKDQKLANWVRAQHVRHQDKAIRKDRAERLESIGFVWNPKPATLTKKAKNEERWFYNYECLKKFVKENGHFSVSRVDENTKKLGEWVKTQRLFYRLKKLRKDRIALLNEIGFPWSAKPTLDTRWAASYDAYKEYLLQKNDTTNGPLALTQALKEWTYNQRLMDEKGTLEPERKALLDEIGFDWKPLVAAKRRERSTLEELWNHRYQELVEFHEKHHHFRVPASGESKILNSWANNQRSKYRRGMQPRSRIDKLNAIGFPWNPVPRKSA
jgi:hypothetical protein